MMNSNSTDFSLHVLEARFEMQFQQNEFIGEGGGGSGADYGYYGSSWGSINSEPQGYIGPYQVASDGSGAMLDDGTLTDGSAGAFPAFPDPHICLADPNFFGCPPQPNTPSRCTICRC
jgi:hypothetical protein